MKKSPQFIYTTRCGQFYHLTPFHQAPLQLDAALLSIGDFTHLQQTLNNLKNFDITIKKYLNLEKFMLYLTSIDSYKSKCIYGSMYEDSVKIQQKEGIKKFSQDEYIQLAKIINPEIIVAMTESPEIDAGMKSIKRSIKKSAYFLQNTLQQLSKYNISVFGALQGGISSDVRNMAAESMKFAVDHPNFAGFTLYGFNQSDPWMEKEQSLEAVFEAFQGFDLNYILAGKGEILSILWGINWGIDAFEIEEPFSAAQNLKAIKLIDLDATDAQLDEYQNDRVNYYEFEEKKIQYIQFPMQLNAKDHIPIDSKCNCFTCQNHSQLYISHLVECKEMNAQVLLTIHNVYSYQRLQQKLYDLLENKKLNQWIRWFLNEL